jgi:hypothetical protein
MKKKSVKEVKIKKLNQNCFEVIFQDGTRSTLECDFFMIEESEPIAKFWNRCAGYNESDEELVASVRDWRSIRKMDRAIYDYEQECKLEDDNRKSSVYTPIGQ